MTLGTYQGRSLLLQLEPNERELFLCEGKSLA
jgi:hypothetical protein